jgi:uncharacterized protein (TIGR00369 family)
VVMAVNREYVREESALREGDELALIPPVSGGAELPEASSGVARGGGAASERTGLLWDAVAGRVPPPPCARLLGWTPIEVEPGFARIQFEAREQFLNPGDVVQGGFLAAMLDDTMGPAAVSLLGPGFFSPTLEMKVSFLRPARAGRLVAEGRVVHRGRSVVFLAGSLRDGSGSLVASATATSRIAQFEQPGSDRADRPVDPVELDGRDPVARRGKPSAAFLELVSVKVGPPASSRLLGGFPIGAEPGRATIEFEARTDFYNPAGVVQGGFLAAMLDDTMGPAAITLLEPGLIVTTLELKTSFLRPARAGRLTAEARVLHGGKSIVFSEAELKADDGRLIATATGTARIVPFNKPAR